MNDSKTSDINNYNNTIINPLIHPSINSINNNGINNDDSSKNNYLQIKRRLYIFRQ